MGTATNFAGSVPGKYDQYLGPLLFEPYAKDIAERITGSPKNVLEIACGTGRVTKHIRATLPMDVTIVATDLNKDMLEIAKAANAGSNIEWHVTDAQDIHFNDESFDLVICQFGFMFMPDKELAFAESFRVLKNEGYILFSCWDKLANNDLINTGNTVLSNFFPGNPPVFYQIPFSFHDTELMHALLAKAGFKNIQIECVEKEAVGTAAEAAMGIVEGNPVYDFIVEKDPSLLNEIRSAVEKSVAEKFGSNPLKAPMRAWIVRAGK